MKLSRRPVMTSYMNGGPESGAYKGGIWVMQCFGVEKVRD